MSITLEWSGKNGFVTLELPADSRRMNEMLREATDSQETITWRCVECPVPVLTALISAEENAERIDQIARRLAELDEKNLMAYQALLAAKGADSLTDALVLAGEINDYIQTPEFRTYRDIAMGELEFKMDEDKELLIPFVDLEGYGKAIAERDGLILTEFGSIEPKPVTE